MNKYSINRSHGDREKQFLKYIYIYIRIFPWVVDGLTGSDNRPMAIVKRHENVKPGKEDKR